MRYPKAGDAHPHISHRLLTPPKPQNPRVVVKLFFISFSMCVEEIPNWLEVELDDRDWVFELEVLEDLASLPMSRVLRAWHRNPGSAELRFVEALRALRLLC